MIQREILQKIKHWLSKEKILIIKGARQVGKTYLLKEIKKDLELEENFEYWEWVATIYYYSMLKVAKTIIAKKGYQTDDHYATLCALAKLFVVKNELDVKVLELFKEATELFEQKYVLYFHDAMESASKSRYDISMDFDKQKALEIKDKAIEFRKECLRILKAD